SCSRPSAATPKPSESSSNSTNPAAPPTPLNGHFCLWNSSYPCDLDRTEHAPARFPFLQRRAIVAPSRRKRMSVNKVILVGRLGRDPETRYTGGGQAVANFSVATDETYKDRNGERQKRTEWHKIVVWGKQAEIAQQYLKKGSLVFIEGRIQSREWQ